MTESAESSQVAFHFSPPTVLLRPVLNITPSPCFEMSSESQKEILNGMYLIQYRTRKELLKLILLK